MCRNWVNCLCVNVNQFVSLSDLAHLSRPDRVGVHWQSCVISLPSPAASPMPRLAAHCLHTSIKSSIFFCSTPILLSTHLSCFAPTRRPRSSYFKCRVQTPCSSFILTQPVSLLMRCARAACQSQDCRRPQSPLT